MIGLGRMGLNMTRRLLRHRQQVVVWDRSLGPIADAEADGAIGASSPADVVRRLTPPRAVWVMVPSGAPTAAVIEELADHLEPGDIVIDGGNSKWKETVERATALAQRGIELLDSGTSGGIWGLENGYCLMIGGSETAFEQVEEIFRALAPEQGYARMGPSGSGHFVKMVHNGIEYGMLQAYGEGFEVLRRGSYELDLGAIATVWNRGSVVRSWLLELAELAFVDDPELDSVAPYVEDSGEGRWTIEAAIEEDVPAPATVAALFARFASRGNGEFSAKVIAALRKQFGGHGVRAAVPQKPPTGEVG
ncbi:MAG: phosphogluconate dehydrogenase (NAD(+)-dependent, decarboxylating) [Actinomycetota bacterium]